MFFGDFLSSTDNNSLAEGGGGTTPLDTISFAFNSFPYRLLLASLSGRRVEPASEIPANNPRAREYDRISARRVTSVSAEAFLPTGPAAAEASPPIFTLLVRMLSADLGVMSSRTKSVAWPPSCKPKLAPSR